MSGFSYNTATRIIEPGAESDFDVTGTYVLAVAASHTSFGIRVDGGAKQFWDVGIQIGGSSVDLPFRQISVVNDGATALTITLAHGSGDFADRRLTFTGGALPVSFDGPQDVAQSGVWSVGVTDLPAIDFNGPQDVAQSGVWNVGVTGLPAIDLNGPQDVTQSGVWNVGVTGLPAIDLNGPQPVTQSGTWKDVAPNVFLSGGNINVLPGNWYAVSAANLNRKRIVVSNLGTETVWLRSDNSVQGTGLPLVAGGVVEIFSTQAIYAVGTGPVASMISVHQEYWT